MLICREKRIPGLRLSAATLHCLIKLCLRTQDAWTNWEENGRIHLSVVCVAYLLEICALSKMQHPMSSGLCKYELIYLMILSDACQTYRSWYVAPLESGAISKQSSITDHRSVGDSSLAVRRNLVHVPFSLLRHFRGRCNFFIFAQKPASLKMWSWCYLSLAHDFIFHFSFM